MPQTAVCAVKISSQSRRRSVTMRRTERTSFAKTATLCYTLRLEQATTALRWAAWRPFLWTMFREDACERSRVTHPWG